MDENSQAAEAALTQANSEAAIFEVGFHVIPTVAEGDVGGVVEKVRVALGGAEHIKEEFPRRMILAYPIERTSAGRREKFAEAYFGYIKFATDRTHILAIQEALRGLRDILRFLVVETVREENLSPRRAVFSSDRLEGQTLKKPVSAPEEKGEVSEEELDKSIEALVS